MKTLRILGFPTLTSTPTSRPSARRRLAKGMLVLGAISLIGSAPACRRHSKDLSGRLQKLCRKRRFLPPLLVDAVVGALGEIGQLAILYPVDTIKVRCQAQGSSTRAVWTAVRQQGFESGNVMSLWAGCAPSAVCAAVIGACYLASFCATKRVLARPIAAVHCQAQALASAVTSTTSRGTEETGAAQGQEWAQGNDRQAVAEESAANHTAAALIASVLTSILEAPVELFRHRMQAGLSRGRMLNDMATAFGEGGLTSLYWGYAPFVLKSIPYDVAELLSYSQLTEHQCQIPLLRSLPVTYRDCFIGAMAGAAAVLISMPADCIKTRLELGATRPPPGLLSGSATFFRTGRAMVAERGLRSMFVGVIPRLLENVPSTMFYWVLVLQLRRWLEPYTSCSQLQHDSRSGMTLQD